MNDLFFLDGLTPLERRLIDLCRAEAEDDQVLINAKDLLKVVALQDWKMDEGEFEYDCEALSSHVEPIEAYSPGSVGYAYRTLLRMGLPWRCRYPYFDLRGMVGDPHDEIPQGPEYVELRLSRFAQIVMPVGKPPLLPLSLLNGASLPDGTAIPSHPLEELWAAFEHVRQDPDISLDDLMEYLPGPDFASAGVVGDPAAIRAIYADGKGELVLRGEIQTEMEGARTRLAIVSLPPGVLIQQVLDQIRSLLQQEKIHLFLLKNESERERIRIVLDAPRRWSATALKEILFHETDLEKRVLFHCSFSDASGFRGGVSLVETLKQAAVRCTLSWGRKDDEPIEHVPLLREIQRFGGYKSPLTGLIDRRRSRLLRFS
ncbi:MAG: DNA gyrase subunit A [Candidatus Manganitrophaceae bacterium]